MQTNYCFSQKEKDSLYVIHLIKKSENLLQTNVALDSANHYLKKAFNLSNKSNLDSLSLDILFRLAVNHNSQASLEESYYKKAIEIAKKSTDNNFLCLAYIKYAYYKQIKIQDDEAILLYEKALKIAKSTKNHFYLAVIYSEISYIYMWRNDMKRSQDLSGLALEALQSIPLKNTKSAIESKNINTRYVYIYVNLARTFSDEKRAFLYIDLAKQIINRQKRDELTFEDDEKMYFTTIIQLYIKFKLYDLAIQNSLEVLDKAKKLNQIDLVVNSYYDITKIYTLKRDFNKAKQYLMLFVSNAQKYDYDSFSTNFNRLAAEIYRETGDTEKAIYFMEKEVKRLDSISEIKEIETISDFKIKFDVQEKQNKIIKQELLIKELENKRIRNVFIFIILFLVSFFFVTYYMYKQRLKRKLENQAFLREKEFNNFQLQFLENITHEIRTPLTLMNGYLQLASESDTLENCKHNIKKAQNNSTSVLNNANELLNLSKKVFPHSELQLDTFELNQFVHAIFILFESSAILKQITLNYHDNLESRIFVETDKKKLEIILNNLITNAIKYSNSNSKIALFLDETNDHIIIKVKDEGIGISAKDTQKIFDRFFQSSNANLSGGFGIGLALSKELAIVLGGTITVESHLGHGSEFSLIIPKTVIVNRENSSTIIQNNDIIPSSENDLAATKPIILIVEDNSQMCEYYAEILNNHFQCVFAFDGKEGLKKAQNQQFELVISDIMMPNMDGFTLRNLLKLIPSYNLTPFLFISAKALSSDKIKGFSIGVDDYVTKPFNKNELIARLNNLLINLKSRKIWIKENPDTITLPIQDANHKILTEIENYIVKHIKDENINLADLSLKLSFSQRSLSNLVHEITGLTLVQFVLEIKLLEAYKMIQNKEFRTINEVRYAIGINSVSYFNRVFKSRFGISPSQLKNKNI